ncbi:MAG TPA: carboxypeptidase-like regulatory domain-containing protein [Candidatus Acidoferrales bacterium]|nr:carboxypeptidase-like regulatory domain-containing protein [Candidatus Acidoferrales bacterium]
MRLTSALKYVAIAFVFAFSFAGAASAQVSPTGTLVGTVTDPSGATIPGAAVTAKGATTGAIVTTTSGSDGRFVMATMTPGVYNVTVTKDGFKTGVFTEVKITVGLTYELKAKLEIGAASTTVVVESGVQELHTASASISSTVVGPEITQLPFASRDTLNGLAILDPGAQTAGNPRNTSFDGLPKGSINITEDGINVQDNLLKSSDGFFSIIANKVDTIAEFNITTAANSAAQSGEGAVQISMVSNKGGNQFHGGVWEYFRNTYLDSNYYFNNLAGQPRQIIKSNQFGFKVGGPILKDKLFFFGDMDNYKFPHSVARTPTVPTTLTAQGQMAYTATAAQATNPNAWTTCAGTACTVDLLAMASANGNTSTPDSVSSGIFTAMASAATASGVTSLGNPAPYLNQISFLNTGVDNRYFPDVRLDYDVNQKNSIEFAYHYAHFTSNPDFLNGFDPTLPVAPFSTEVGGQISNRNLFVGAWRTTLGSNMSNEVRFGVQSAPVSFFPNLGLGIYPIATTNLGPEHVQPQFAAVNSSIVTEPFHSFATQGRNTALGQLTDNFAWTKGSHFLNFGMTATDLRFNDFFDSGSVATVPLGIDSSDPAANMFTNSNLPGMAPADVNAAEQIYANIVGRVDGYSASVNLNPSSRQFQTGAPQLDKVRMLEMGYYGTDSWQVRPGMTFNYGLRWEYQGIPHDALNEYFNLQNGYTGVFGVSGLNNIFKPGTLSGSVPVFSLNGSRNWYNKYYHSFGPSVGIAWQPGFQNNIYRKVFGGTGNTVFRAGYSVSFDRPGLNNFESLGPSNGGFVGFQFMNPGTTTAPGEFQGGSIALGSLNLPDVAQSPTSFTTSFTLDPLSGAGVNVYNPNLHAPYVQSWSAGIQRQVGGNTVFEVRYVGNHAVGLWEQADLNETNIVENQFLAEFNNAASNLSICQAASCTTGFADAGLPGQVSLPILQAAFTGSQAVSSSSPFFTNGTFERDLGLGLAGSFANSLAKAGSLTFICNMAGANGFPAGECPGTAPAVGAYPKNFFITNPDAVGGAFVLYNGGQSTYNSLQIDVRRRMAAGLQFNGSYTFGKALTNQFANSSVSFFQFSTLRNPGLNKGPAAFDVRHSFKLESLYDLPFGPGHRLTTGNGLVNRLIGGWSFNTVTRWHTGRVQLLTGGLGGTVNGNDGGVNITGMSLSQIQSRLGVIKTPCHNIAGNCVGAGEVFYFPATLLSNTLANGGGRANSAIFTACSTPGSFCGRPFIYGPGFFRADWSVVKDTKITEKTSFELRLDALNLFNNADFFYGGTASQIARSTSIQSNSFGRITSAYQDTGADDFGGRILEIVARINF